MESRWYEKAKAFGKLGRHKVAIHCCDRGIEANPRDAKLWCFKGMTLEKLGRHEEGMRCYDRAIDINPFFATAWFNKAAILGNFGRYREALACFEEAHRQGHPRAAQAAEECLVILGKTTGRSTGKLPKRKQL